MSDIELVIKMPKEKYKWIKENNPKADKNSIVGAIVYGTPLPKGHGDLIDKTELLKNYGLEDAVEYDNKTPSQMSNSYSTIQLYEIADTIRDAHVVIEADKENKDE